MKKPKSEEQGYILMIVMVLLIVLATAGVYGLRTAQADLKSSAAAKRSDIAAYAAEAGIALRIAELMLTVEDAGAGLNSSTNGVEAMSQAQRQYPDPLTPGLDPNAPVAEWRVVAEPMVAVEAAPPPGVQIGSAGQATVWRIESFAVTRLAGLTSPSTNSQKVSVGLSVWSRGGMSYNIN